jgi:succinyl-CoA synthetase alpha subunit
MLHYTSETKVLIQGITEPLGAAHSVLMKGYGTNIVAGVSPGCSQKKHHGIPLFDLVESAQHAVGPIDLTIICVHSYRALDAALEAIDAGIRQLIILTEGMPPLDMVYLLRKAEHDDTLIVGPSCPGIIVPGQVLLGTHPPQWYRPGSVGTIGRSSTLMYEVALTLTQAGLGQSIGVGIGSSTIIGSSFPQWLQILDEDEATEAIVLVGEIGGESEEEAAQYIAEAIDTPVVAYVAGQYAPKSRRLGHAGAIVASQLGSIQTTDDLDFQLETARRKIEAFQKADIPVASCPSEIPQLLKKLAVGGRC